MKRPAPKREGATTRRKTKVKPQPSRFAPTAFVTASPEGIQRRCDELALAAARAFGNRKGLSWNAVGTAFAKQVRESGHDLVNFEDTDDLQEWQATLYHPTGTFLLFLSFRPPRKVEVTYKTDDRTYVSQA